MHATFSVLFSTAKGAVVSQAMVSPLTWWSLARKMSKVADRIFRSSSNFSLFWWQILVQTSDTTERSQIAKACAHSRRPDRGCLFRSYPVDIYAVRSFFCLFALWRIPTRHRSTSLELQLPTPGSCCRRPRLFCCQRLQTFVQPKRMFVIASNELLPNVRRDLFLLATCYVSHCY